MTELFTTFGVNWKLLVMQAVNFGLLLLVLWKYVYTPVLKLIDERREQIAEGVRTAEAATRRLAEADTEAKGLVGAAAKDGEALVASARLRADEKAQEILKSAEAKATQALADATLRAEETKRKALQESEKEITRAAMLAAEKILAHK
jgi:F-type H+-transporting ATPase subunit b